MARCACLVAFVAGTVDHGGGKAQISDRPGDTREVGQPVDQVGGNDGALRQRSRQVLVLWQGLTGRDDHVGSGEPIHCCVCAQTGLGQHSDGGDEGRSAHDGEAHGDDGP